MYFNQSATPTTTHLSKNQHQTIPKIRQQQIHTNTQKKNKKKKPNPPLHINLRLLEQIIREHIEEEKKIRSWLKPSTEKTPTAALGCRSDGARTGE